MGPELDAELKLRADRRLRLSTTESGTNIEIVESVAVDNGILADGEVNDKDIDSEFRGFDPIENRFIALSSVPLGQQEAFSVILSKESFPSQHINPAAHSSVQRRTATPKFVKLNASAPLSSSVSQIDCRQQYQT